MTDPKSETWLEPGYKNAQLVYFLFFLSFLLGGLPSIIGVVFAHLNRGKIGGLIDNHYTWLIRTFWISVLYALVAALLMIVGIGFLLFVALLIWTLIRLVKGVQRLSRGESMPDVNTWLI
ncbi:MAG: hypothetical protein AAFY99_07355 [Pseudomonadota bacterium]